MKICIVNFTGNRGNWGCQATSRNLMDFLHKSLSGFDNLEISTVPLPRQHPLDELVGAVHGSRIRSIYANPAPNDTDLKFLETLVKERFGPALERVKAADVVLFQGEGTIGPQEYLHDVRVYALPLLSARLWKKPVLSMNQTLYACDGADADVLKQIFSAFDLVAVREAMSYRFCRSIGLDRTILCPDFAFARSQTSASVEVKPPSEPYFCVTGSAAIGDYNVPALIRTIGKIADRHGLKPVFIFSRKPDLKELKIAKKVLKSVPFDVVTWKEAPDFQSILGLLAGARFVVSGRYHTAISALAEGTPVVLLPGNTYKSEGLGPMLQIDIPVLAPQDAPAIQAYVETILDQGRNLRDDITTAVDRIRTAHDTMAAVLRDHLAGLDFDPAQDRIVRPDPDSFKTSDRHAPIYLLQNRAKRDYFPWTKPRKLEQLRNQAEFQQSLTATISKFE